MKESKRFLEIDALRGLAAIGIVLFHYGSAYTWPEGHFYGYFSYLEECVQAFFIISGFVILISLNRLQRILDFVVGRFARLYPVYWLSVILTIVLVYVAQISPPRTELPFDILANFSMLQEFLGAENINIVYWTMTLELAFYTIMILIFKLKCLKYMDYICAAWLCLICLDTVKGSLSYTPSGIEVAYSGYLISLFDTHQGVGHLISQLFNDLKDFIKINFILIRGRANLFIAGILLYQSYLRGFSPYRVGLIVVCVVIEIFDYSPDTPWYSFLVFGSFVLILYLCINDRLAFLSQKYLVFLGQISYSLYLIHIQIGWIFKHLFKNSSIFPELLVLIQLATAILIAAIVTLTIENSALIWIKNLYKNRFSQRKKGLSPFEEEKPLNVNKEK